MCGIVGYVGKKQVIPKLIHGLKKLELGNYLKLLSTRMFSVKVTLMKYALI